MAEGLSTRPGPSQKLPLPLHEPKKLSLTPPPILTLTLNLKYTNPPKAWTCYPTWSVFCQIRVSLVLGTQLLLPSQHRQCGCTFCHYASVVTRGQFNKEIQVYFTSRTLVFTNSQQFESTKSLYKFPLEASNLYLQWYSIGFNQL